MRRFDVESLSEADRAFVEAFGGIHAKLEALKIVFPSGARLTAIKALQLCLVRLLPAATGQD